MYLIGKNRNRLIIFTPVVAIFNGDRYFQGVFGRALVGPFDRSTISKVSSYRQPYVAIIGHTIVGGVQPDPSIKRKVRLYPGMGGPFSPEFVIFRTDIAADSIPEIYSSFSKIENQVNWYAQERA